MQHWQWRRSVESGWFYAAWFSFFAAAVLFIGQHKYGERQAGIERRFQARSQPLSVPEGELASGESAGAEDYYSTPEDTVIPLWPLAALLIVLAAVFAALAVRAGWKSTGVGGGKKGPIPHDAGRIAPWHSEQSGPWS